jgi:hypothetical protein
MDERDYKALNNSIKERAKKVPQKIKDKVTKDMLNAYADACMNEYLVGLLCTKTIPMPNPDSNSIAESIINFLNNGK